MPWSGYALYLNECLPSEVTERSQSATKVFSLLECLPIQKGARYKFVRVEHGGRSTVGIGRAQSKAPTRNLAVIRHRGANLSANEVHILD
jgi:hypothetical protein